MPTILIVDDSSFARAQRAKALRQAGFSLLEAPDGHEALQTVRTSGPDLVLTDLIMPVLDGQAFIKKLRASGSRVPVIVLSADTQPATAQACLELGAAAVLEKSIDNAALIAAIYRALSNSASSIAKKEAA